MSALPKATKIFIVVFFLYEILFVLGAFSTRYFFVLGESHRAVSLGLIIILTFLLVRARKNDAPQAPWFDYVLMTAGAIGCFYIAPTSRIVELQMASPEVGPFELALGVVTIIVLLEGTRRVSGAVLPTILVFFIVYALFANRFPGIFYGRGHSFDRVIGELYLSVSGVFGDVMGLWTRVLVVFILFGSFLQVSGAGKFFIDLALSVSGHLRGGPAKVAVIASGLFGTVSGSAAADVATTGVVTIPMMKDASYRPAFAGAVEAVASTGGVLMPPMMGMVAFMVAEFLDIPYLEVCIAAAVPAASLLHQLVFSRRSRSAAIRTLGTPKGGSSQTRRDAESGLALLRASRRSRVLSRRAPLSPWGKRALRSRGAFCRHLAEAGDAIQLDAHDGGLRTLGAYFSRSRHHLRIGRDTRHQRRYHRHDVEACNLAGASLGRISLGSARSRRRGFASARYRCARDCFLRLAGNDSSAGDRRSRRPAHRRPPVRAVLGDQPT